MDACTTTWMIVKGNHHVVVRSVKTMKDHTENSEKLFKRRTVHGVT